jgi:hypothetical protein
MSNISEFFLRTPRWANDQINGPPIPVKPIALALPIPAVQVEVPLAKSLALHGTLGISGVEVGIRGYCPPQNLAVYHDPCGPLGAVFAHPFIQGGIRKRWGTSELVIKGGMRFAERSYAQPPTISWAVEVDAGVLLEKTVKPTVGMRVVFGLD